jgi:glycine cleavage system H protein
MIRLTGGRQIEKYLCKMNMERNRLKDLYFTNDHEWIDFRGTVAYTGICGFKLLGFKEIHEIIFHEPSGFKDKGEIIATIRYNDYQVRAHMPVECKIIEINNELLSGNQNLLLVFPESSGWIVKIAPYQPYDRKDLLLLKEYQMNAKEKYAK